MTDANNKAKQRPVRRDLFEKRLKRLKQFWNEDASLSGVGSIAVCVGSDSEAPVYCKSASMQLFLMGFEILDCLFVATKDEFFALTSERKAQLLPPDFEANAADGIPAFRKIIRNKADGDAAAFARILDAMKTAGGSVGVFAKDVYDVDFSKAWQRALKDAGLQTTDIASSVGALFCEHDDAAVELLTNAARASVAAYSHVRRQLIDYIDADKKIKHRQVAKKIEDEIGDVRVQGALVGKARQGIDTCYAPIVQSGGVYSFKWSTESSDALLHYGSMVTSLGARFDFMCSNVARTLLVVPGQEVERAYESVLTAEMAVIDALRPGALLSDVYRVGLDKLRALNPAYEQLLKQKEFGHATGFEFRESTLTISAKCEKRVKAGMVFVVAIGLDGVRNSAAKDEAGRKTAVFLSDTVLVEGNGGPPTILTAAAKSRLKSNLVRLEEEDADDERKENKETNGKPSSSSAASSPKKKNSALQALIAAGSSRDGSGQGKSSQDGASSSLAEGRSKRSVVLNEQTRNKTTNEERRKEKQKELGEELNRAAQQRLAHQTQSSDTKKAKKSTVSYKSIDRFPTEPEVAALQIFVDRRHDSVILPIFGVPVPFHIGVIKNCSTSVEGDYTYLRINLNHPGSQIGSKEAAQYTHPLATYIKEMTYRSSNVKEPGEIAAPSNNLSTAFRLIKEMQKKWRAEEAEEREREGAVRQDKLLLTPQGRPVPKLKDLYVRPNIIAKRVSGSLEAHENGFRYTSLRGDKIDVLYNNVKHAFFQPCDNEMIILLHFHLKDPVLWGKKKYTDIQFYTEVGEITTDLGKYHHMQDRDDLRNEQMERELRKKLNAVFQAFCEKVQQKATRIDFDSPYVELGFFGVPHRSSCTLRPTASALVNLTEWPPFVVTLEEVELVHFERVSFQVKNFDMVFIFKDYARKTQMVQQVPMSSLDSIKEWLNSCDLRYTEGPQSLNWAKIMKTIVDDPEGFFAEGGWNFLNTDDSDEENKSGGSSSESEYMEGEEEGEGSESDSDEEESDADEDESGDDDDDDGSGSGSGSLDSDESEGKDWSDLEEEARKADKQKDREERERDVRGGGGGGGGDKHKHRGGGGGGDKHRSGGGKQGASSSSGKRPGGGGGGPPDKKAKHR